MNTKKQTLKKHQHIKLVQRSFDEERFEIALQEIISNTNPNEKTYEALARLKTADGNRYVSPIEFIAIINLLGRNIEFTDIIVKKVCLVMQEIDGTFNINLTEDDLNTP
jgi:EAL domain-containing protein (putative c-di-GMP-specific phosphodiesterase class I)